MCNTSVIEIVDSRERIINIVARSFCNVRPNVKQHMQIRKEVQFIIEAYITDQSVYTRSIVTLLQHCQWVAVSKRNGTVVGLSPFVITAEVYRVGAFVIYRLCRIKSSSATYSTFIRKTIISMARFYRNIHRQVIIEITWSQVHRS